MTSFCFGWFALIVALVWLEKLLAGIRLASDGLALVCVLDCVCRCCFLWALDVSPVRLVFLVLCRSG